MPRNGLGYGILQPTFSSLNDYIIRY